MKHLGDITKIDGTAIPVVDVITGGSPCQDLSVAGKRAGLAGERSGLFMEQIRIIKEMREEDRKNGRTNEFIRPRYMVWENVPGALSSNSGEDFRAVLEETARIAEEDAVIPRPSGKWGGAGTIVGDGWSIAWRVHDAQFWGVPQRRKRIALVADFGGHTAPEILFERKSVFGDFEQGGEKRKGASAGTEKGIGSAISFQERAGKPGGQRNVCVMQKETTEIVMESAQAHAGIMRGRCPTLNASHEQPIVMSDRKGHNGITDDGTATTLTAQEKERPTIAIKEMKDATSRNKILQILQKAYGEEAVCKWCIAVVERIQQTDILQQGVYESSLQGQTENREKLDGDTPPCPYVVAEWIVRDMRKQQECRCSSQGSKPTEQRNNELTESMQELSQQNTQTCKYLFNMWSKGKGIGLLRQALSEIQEIWKSIDDKGQPVHCNSVVRRLTPLETERLQGMPDNWSKYGINEKGEVFELSDSARYKLQGNGIATPFWRWMLKRISAQYERTPTLGSLFDGQGSFPMIWEGINGKGTALWSSEIEKAAIAVTKYHFGGYEIDKEYFDNQEERFAKHTAQMNIFQIGNKGQDTEQMKLFMEE